MSKVSEFIELKGPLVKEYVEILRGIEVKAGHSGVIVPFAASNLPENGCAIAFECGVILGFEKGRDVYVYFDVRAANAVRVATSNALCKMPNCTICDDLVLCNEDIMLHGVDALLAYADELEFTHDQCGHSPQKQVVH